MLKVRFIVYLCSIHFYFMMTAYSGKWKKVRMKMKIEKNQYWTAHSAIMYIYISYVSIALACEGIFKTMAKMYQNNLQTYKSKLNAKIRLLFSAQHRQRILFPTRKYVIRWKFMSYHAWESAYTYVSFLWFFSRE